MYKIYHKPKTEFKTNKFELESYYMPNFIKHSVKVGDVTYIDNRNIIKIDENKYRLENGSKEVLNLKEVLFELHKFK
jgi:mRNA-degrading endonuclease HigB of HigAB toxin-antitoxin module